MHYMKKCMQKRTWKYIHSYASSFRLDFEIIYCKTWNFNKLAIWYTHSFDFLIVLSLQRWDILHKHFHSYCTLRLLSYIEPVASNPVNNESSKVMTSSVLDLLYHWNKLYFIETSWFNQNLICRFIQSLT